MIKQAYIALLIVILFSCQNKQAKVPVLFKVLDATTTGLQFSNTLVPTPQFNMFTYMYFYNGAGIGAGDFNNDGLVDLFFASNQQQNSLYLSTGKLHFKDVTAEAKIPVDKSWSTGVSVVDINNDGLLDIYVCRVGQYEVLKSKNQLLVCKGIDKNGVPFYEDEAQQYGLDFSGFSTQAVFLDYDMDGDLDMFLLNHSVHQNGSFAPRKNFVGTYDALSGDRLYRNDGNHFTDVTRASKINSSAISYGLGVAVADINMDGYPDIYAGNDFHENDYLYINQRDGTFKDELNERIMHTSQFSMGVDVADITNDGLPEIVSVDMLPEDPYILKRSLGGDDYDVFNAKIKDGYSYQYSRNNLQFNRGNGMFSETGLYSGIYATDWSWAPLFADFNNDGLKDLFISNGIPKRLNDMDYVNFVSGEELQQKIQSNQVEEKDLALVNKFPEIKLPNKVFINKGNMSFDDAKDAIQNNEPTYSNGAVYADLDNDGDLDVVVNNINATALVYENTTNDNKHAAYTELVLHGPEKNVNALGAKVIVFAKDSVRLYEKYAAKGFQSSMEAPLHIGLVNTKVDSALLVWPDNSFQRIQLLPNKKVSYSYTKNLPAFNYNSITNRIHLSTYKAEDITHQVKLDYLHQENFFPEFDREPLQPHMLSTEGPALAVGDVNHDGLEDVYIGAAKTKFGAIFLQQQNGTFERTKGKLDADSMYEDVDACFIDINNDGNIDLVTASGGNEFHDENKHLLPRAFLNDGKGNFTRLEDAFSNVNTTISCIQPYDFNGDGFVDLFIGSRDVPWKYGEIPNSYLLANDGSGKFIDVTAKYAPELTKLAMITNATWYDIDKDGDKDLIVSTEWDGIYAFINTRGSFKKHLLCDKKGWWNFILPIDIDNDGDIDLIAGNLGLNSRLHANNEQPVRMYYNDFDNNAVKEQLLTYYLQGVELPFANKDEIQRKLPILKKNYLYAQEFSKANLTDIFSEDKLKSSTIFTANWFQNTVLINDGKMHFTARALPWQAQLSTYRDAVIVDANGDSLPDVLLFGNYYDSNVQMGRYDADYGSILINKGDGNFDCQPLNGLQVKGQVRHIKAITINKQQCYVLARNNDSAMVITFKGNK